MVGRRASLAPLGMLLVLASGCPEKDDDPDGDEFGDTGETGSEIGETGSDPTGVEGEEDDVRPPLDTEAGGDGDGDGDGEVEGDGDGDGDGYVDDPNRCWDDTWSGDVLPHVILGNTTDHFDMFTGSCGDGPAPNWELGFIAPWDGHFAFDTSGSSFDTVVYVHDGECGDKELACNDDFIGLDSRVVVELDEGELITVSVDGTGPFEQGLFTLEISEAVLPVCETEFVLPALPTIVLGDTSDADSQLASGCGGEGAPERLYEFVAPGPGSYRFDTFGSSFDTVLYALDECEEAPLACNDDADFDIQSELVLNLAGGQHVMIVVDGFGPGDAGPFLLNVEEV
jgi:hypothetical protein